MTPFKFEKIQINHSTIHICSFDYFLPKLYLKYLSKEEIIRFNQFKSENRQREFVASRILKHRIFGFQFIEYSENGAPYIENHGFISISHCKGAVGLACNKKHQVGLDLEIKRPNIQKLGPKFLSEKERVIFDIKNDKVLTKIWSAKECLYKLAGRKKIIFKTELLIDMNQDSEWIGTIINQDHVLSVKIDTFELNEVIITLNKEDVEKNSRYI